MSKRAEKSPPDALATFRVRETQSFTGSLIASFFGPFAESQPDLWTRRTFLLLVAKVYERLVIDKEQLTSKDFQEIAKTLVEITKADVVHGGRDAPRTVGNKLDAGSPEALAETLEQIVREIYGTNLHAAGSGKNQAKEPSVLR